MDNKPYYDPKTNNHNVSSLNTNKYNRLIHEESPYLRQYAYNPVDWYPWGAEAFQKAQRENRPVLLSVGYS